MVRLLQLSVLILAVSGCTTIHFDRGEPSQASRVSERWHHNFALALFEGSEAVDPQKECGDRQWQSVKTELSVVNAIAGGVVNNLGPIWYPKTVTISCGSKDID